MDDIAYWERLVNRSLCRFFLLNALKRKPMHGYELGKSIAQACHGCCQPTDAMIYPTLHELLEGDYIECRSELTEGRNRKVYRLTEKGLEACRVAAEAWEKAIPYLIDATQAPTHAETQPGRKDSGEQ